MEERYLSRTSCVTDYSGLSRGDKQELVREGLDNELLKEDKLLKTSYPVLIIKTFSI